MACKITVKFSRRVAQCPTGQNVGNIHPWQ